MEKYLNESDCIKLAMLELLLGSADSEVNLGHILRTASRGGCRTLEILSSKEKSERSVASKVRWDERQRPKAVQEERARRDVQEVDEEVDQNWTAACEWIAKKMLKYFEGSEVLKVSTRDLKEQVLSPDESSVRKVRIARQASSEESEKFFQIFRQGANEVLIASMARWEEHLEGLVVLERHCMVLTEEVEH